MNSIKMKISISNLITIFSIYWLCFVSFFFSHLANEKCMEFTANEYKYNISTIFNLDQVIVNVAGYKRAKKNRLIDWDDWKIVTSSFLNINIVSTFSKEKSKWNLVMPMYNNWLNVELMCACIADSHIIFLLLLLLKYKWWW